MSTIAERVAARYKGKKELDSGNVVYEYSKGQIDHRNSEKAKRLEGLRGNIGKLRSQVQKDLSSSDDEKSLTALVVGLMDETYERVGNDDSAGEGHFGVTGWKKNHVSFSGGKASISYTGKSGVKQKKTVSTKGLVSALKRAYDDCKEGGCITGDVGADAVNAYLKSFSISAKDIRGYHANDFMKGQLKAKRSGALPEDKKEREAQLKDEFTAALEATAEAVGHEASTLKSQYLVPGLEDSYMKDGTVPTKMVKESQRGDSKEAMARRVAFQYLQAADEVWGEVEDLSKRMFALDPKLTPEAANWNHNLAGFFKLVGKIWRRRPERLGDVLAKFDSSDWQRRGGEALDEIEGWDRGLARDIRDILART